MPTLTGIIERIVFRNDETGYTVARMLPGEGQMLFRDDLVTLVGALPALHEGEEVEVVGEWATHARHGRHLRVTGFNPRLPVSAAGLKRYLASGIIKGIGPKTAERIVDRFGEQTLAVLDLEPERLTEVKGISAQMRDRIIAGWAEQHGIREVMLFLREHDVSASLAAKIYKQYGQSAIGVIQENPYALERDINGVGYKTADGLALKLGMPRDALPRLMTGIKHVLSEAANSDGHCFLPRDELLARAAALLECAVAQLPPALDELAREREVFVEEDHIYLAPFFYAERGTAQRLRLLMRAPGTLPPVSQIEWAEVFASLERRQGITLAASQREATQVAYAAKVSVLTGGPGVGKTTALRVLLDVLERGQVSFSLAAPTGRAARRMSEATGRPASTLHRLLEYQPGANEFAYDEHRPLPARFIIVDEVSMLDILLAYRLMRAVRPEAHLLLVGDADQLPSVGPGSVLRDILASESVPVTRLTELFRQSAQSAIIVSAHGVNRGEMPALTQPKDSDFFFIRREDPAAAQRMVVDLVASRIPRSFGLDPARDIQVLSPMYRGPAGVDALNKALQETLNPPNGPSVTYGEQTLRAGDKVMQVRNRYDRGPTGVFNGDVGMVETIEEPSRRVLVRFTDSREVISYEPHELDELTLAWACSIHRAQGSEYPCVVIPLVSQHYLLLQRNLLYTAMTRAKRLCILVGDPRALRRAVENDALATRNTGLAARLRGPTLGG
ncbi:MAG TPA: ATP-dependent RecD-like DNA helicase [Ktedonobacterales bacterium]